jgi:outer membrane immunogenic protein
MCRYSLSLLAAATAIALSVSQASAADLPRKAPAYAPPAPPPFSWTSLYLGIHSGWGWSHSTASVSDDLLHFSPASLDQNGGGFVGGLQAGYNWQFAPTWVIGIEGDISGAGIRKTTVGPLSFGGIPVGVGSNQLAERDIRWLATVRGRFGLRG